MDVAHCRSSAASRTPGGFRSYRKSECLRQTVRPRPGRSCKAGVRLCLRLRKHQQRPIDPLVLVHSSVFRIGRGGSPNRPLRGDLGGRSRSIAPNFKSAMMQSITVRVPASTSNLGPGFDCLGVALRIYNQLRSADRALPRVNPAGHDQEKIVIRLRTCFSNERNERHLSSRLGERENSALPRPWQQRHYPAWDVAWIK